MKFGKVESLEGIDFSLPADAEGNFKKLNPSPANVKVYVGCPVWVNKNWLGKIYPAKARSQDILKYYAHQFNSIELNSTHYHIPDPDSIQKWKKTVPASFQFCPKFPQEISHHLLPKGQANQLTRTYYEILRPLEQNLGLSFLQLAPTFSPREIPFLEAFIERIPPNFKIAWEFRHPDWFKEPHFPQLMKYFEESGQSLVITDVSGRRDVLHMGVPTRSALIRFVGNALDPSDYQRIDAWAERIAQWIKTGTECVYFFIHQPDNDLSPDLAAYFIDVLNQKTGLNLDKPRIYRAAVQQKLF